MRRFLRQRLWKAPDNSHAARFETVVHFCLTAQFSRRVNIARATRQLLAANIAESAAWPNDDKVRVSKRTRLIGKRIESFMRLQEGFSAIESGARWLPALRDVWRHPRLGILHIRRAWARKAATDFESFLTQQSAKSLLAFTAKHPFVSITRVLPRVRITRLSSAARESDTSPQEEVNEETVAAHDDSSADPLEMVLEAERLLIDNQAISLMERHLDTELFGGSEREENRFVRVTLRNSYHEIRVPGSKQVQSVVFEPRLLLHRSGALQLNIRIGSDSALTTNELLSFIWSQNNIVLKSRYAAPWLKGSPWEADAEWLDQQDAGEPLGVLNYAEPVSLRAVFFDHLAAVEREIHQSHTTWTIYPITMLRPGGCCSDGKFKMRHEAELAQIAFRAPGILAQHVARPRDLSIDAETSLYASLGNATHIRWQGEPPAAINELSTTLVIEYALLTQMRLEAMERSLTRPALSSSGLQERYDEAIRLFSELRHGSLRSGVTRDIARHLLSELGADNIRRTIEVALELEASAHATRRSELAARRSWRLALLGTLVAILVAVPPLSQLLNSVAGLPEGAVAPWLNWPVQTLEQAARLGFWGPWAVLGVLVAIVLVASVASFLLRLARVRLPPLRRGHAWPRVVPVASEVRGDHEEERTSIP